MIAKNFTKYPEALRFQMELFSKGYKNQPRIMRLMQVIFSHAGSVPDWVKAATAKAKALVKVWKKAQILINFAAGLTPSKGPATPGQKNTQTGYRGPMGQSWSGRGLAPKWIKELVSLENNREQFRLQ